MGKKAPVWNVSMVGASGVGKTSLVRRYVENFFSTDFMPTFGVQLTKKIIKTERGELILMLWDLAGDDEFRLSKVPDAAAHAQDVRTARANAYILVADVSRRATLDQAILRQERIARDKREKGLPEVPFVLALNKSDLTAWEFDENEVRLLVPAWEITCTSAKSGDGVARIFEFIAARACEPPREDDD